MRHFLLNLVIAKKNYQKGCLDSRWPEDVAEGGAGLGVQQHVRLVDDQRLELRHPAARGRRGNGINPPPPFNYAGI